MSIVTLLSGGLDSCLMSLLTNEIGRDQKPLFIDYGQLNSEKEYISALRHCKKHGIAKPVVINISEYGRVISSGITTRDKHIVDEAFLPGRNMMYSCIYWFT